MHGNLSSTVSPSCCALLLIRLPLHGIGIATTLKAGEKPTRCAEAAIVFAGSNHGTNVNKANFVKVQYRVKTSLPSDSPKSKKKMRVFEAPPSEQCLQNCQCNNRLSVQAVNHVVKGKKKKKTRGKTNQVLVLRTENVKFIFYCRLPRLPRHPMVSDRAIVTHL